MPVTEDRLYRTECRQQSSDDWRYVRQRFRPYPRRMRWTSSGPEVSLVEHRSRPQPHWTRRSLDEHGNSDSLGMTGTSAISVTAKRCWRTPRRMWWSTVSNADESCEGSNIIAIDGADDWNWNKCYIGPGQFQSSGTCAMRTDATTTVAVSRSVRWTSSRQCVPELSTQSSNWKSVCTSSGRWHQDEVSSTADVQSWLV